MRCRRCGFENLPGLTGCARCGAHLASAEPLNVEPPRAGWTKVLRPFRYVQNRAWSALRTGYAAAWGRPEASGEGAGFLGGALSIVPGLGHLVAERGRAAAVPVVCWLIALLGMLVLYRTGWGGACAGLAVVLHAWIIADAVGMPRLPISRRESMRRFLVLCVLVALAYLASARFAGIWVRGVYASRQVPLTPIRAGDFLLYRRNWYAYREPRRGDVVVVSAAPPPGVPARGPRWGERRDATLILAEPGDRVRFGQDGVSVVDPEGHRREYPAVRGLALLDAELVVPEDRWLCYPPEIEYAPGADREAVARLARQVLESMAIVDRSGIVGRVVLLYNPLERRQRVRRDRAADSG